MGRGRACLLISLLYRCEMRDSLSRFRDTVISVCVGRYCVHSTRESRSRWVVDVVCHYGYSNF